MNEQRTLKHVWWRPAAVLAVALAMALVATGVTASEPPLPVQGAVFSWAEEHQNQPVPLIVQHDGTPEDLLAFVRASGGAVEREFHIIPALDVAVPADQVDDLARQDDVTWVSLDAPVRSTGTLTDYGALSTTYPSAINAPQAWQSTTGEGVTVAVMDTGVSSDARDNFLSASGQLRVQWVSPSTTLAPDRDGFGHGTHVGGIVAGYSTKTSPAGKYIGIAPGANLLAVRIADDAGNATVGDLMAGLQFLDDNRITYNIRVLNLSVSSSVAQSYTVDPLDAAVEVLWFHGIVVVVAAGNNGSASDAVHYPPANDPFVITVGAFDDQGTAHQGDDRLADWSSRGNTQDGFAKPEVLAPGANIVSPVSPTSYLATTYANYVVERSDAAYFRMSGTSMATPVVAGLAALILEDHGQWRPGQVKDVLLQTARSVQGQGQGVLADAAVSFVGNPKVSDDGLKPSFILLSALGVADADFNGIRWLDRVDLNGIRWAGLELNGIRWLQVDWSGIRWTNVEFNGIRWGGLDFTGIRWTGIRWTAFVRPDECDDGHDECGLGRAPAAAGTGREHADERAFEGRNNADSGKD